MSKNLSELSGRKGLVDNLFEKIGTLSKETGTPSTADLEQLANEFLIGKANTFGTSSFYDFTKPENKGKKAYICNGSACLCAGKQSLVKEQMLQYFNESEIGHMTCLGRCHENAAFNLNGHNYSGEDYMNIPNLLDQSQVTKEKYNIGGNIQLLTTPDKGLDHFVVLLRKALTTPKTELLSDLKLSGLRGRGGAGFPMGLKWEFCMKEDNETKFIICNADEGDPGAYSDRYLLEQRPFSVLFGMMVGGYIIGAKWGVLYIRAEYPEAIEIIEEAISKLKDLKLLGENILGSDFDFEFKVIKAQGAYICGEESALLNSIEGQRPEVRTRPPFPAQKGLFNKPTVVNNVETFAAVQWIVEHGGAEYKKLGTEKSCGTKLVSLDSFFNNPGIYEVVMGTSLSSVIHELGGGFKEPVKAIHIGGPLGGLVPISFVDKLTIDFESFASNGFMLGHASMVSIPERFAMIEYLEHLMEFAAYESCGKCFPCRLGTTRGHELFSKARNEGYKINKDLLFDLLDTLQKGSLCAHGGGIPLPVKNAFQYFGDELERYLE